MNRALCSTSIYPSIVIDDLPVSYRTILTNLVSAGIVSPQVVPTNDYQKLHEIILQLQAENRALKAQNRVLTKGVIALLCGLRLTAVTRSLITDVCE